MRSAGKKLLVKRLSPSAMGQRSDVVANAGLRIAFNAKEMLKRWPTVPSPKTT
jgi:hypothetical protein